MIQIVILSWLVTTLVKADTQVHLTKTDDIQNLIEIVKKDVDQHLQSIENLRLRQVDHTSDKETNIPSKDSTENDFIMQDTTSVNDQSYSTSGYLSDSSFYYGSVKGRPDIDFPAYTTIPKTSFTCSDKTNLPRFYADMDTGCQIFHVCWPDKQESFLCPMGTIFNQADLTCDYWFNVDCSMTSFYDAMNSALEPDSSKSVNVPATDVPVQETNSFIDKDSATSIKSFVSQFMPTESKITFNTETEKRLKASTSIEQSAGLAIKTQKLARVPNHSRIPLSEHESSSAEPLDKLKDKILRYRTLEAINNAVVAIQNNKSTAHLTPYAERIQNFIRRYIPNDTLPLTNIELSSELHEYDVDAKNSSELLYNKLVYFIARVLHDFDFDRRDREKTKHKISQRDEKLETLKPSLNKKFIVSHSASDMDFEGLDELSATTKARVKRAATTSDASKLSRDKMTVRIYPETKAALLKSYIKLYKAKRA